VPPRATGFPTADAQDDFLRARRREALRRLSRRFERSTRDVDVILPFDDVVSALGRVEEHHAGVQTIPLDSIVGTVDRAGGGVDRASRPTTSRVRTRWERIAGAMRRGEPLPPISVYRVGDVHFVRDGHHRVSVARALGRDDIQASVTEVVTRVGAGRSLRLSDLPQKSHERLFRERVPLPREARARVRLTDPWRYGDLAEGVEAWAFRAMQDRGDFMDRETAARTWYEHEFLPVVEMIDQAQLRRPGATDADAFLEVGCDRYRLMFTHDWSEEILAHVRDERRR
jgi:hypothetical protein